MTAPDRPPTHRPRIDPARRADALLAQLTVAEKISLLHQHQPAIPRLGLRKFHTGCEALHGVAWNGVATVFPQAVGLGASWDRDLLLRVGRAVGTEVRGFAQDASAASGSGVAERPTMVSLNVWAPVVNLLRDPRWGRNEEGYSEDPLATGELATAYCAGLRGDDPVFWRTTPVLKHFLAYNVETVRDTVDIRVPERVLREYELPAFRAPIEAGVVAGVMPAYNLVNGIPNHVHPLINSALRVWDPTLLVCSDAYAPSNLVESEKYFASHVESHAAALRAGLDSYTDLGTDSGPTIERFTEALRQGLISEADLDAAVGRALLLRARTGEFDPDLDPYAGIRADVIGCPAHAALSREAAVAGIVLLKNSGLLPLPDPAAGADGTGPGRIAVIGHLGGEVLTDWYSGTLPYRVSIADGLREALGADAVTVTTGADLVTLRVAGTDGGHVLVRPSESGAGLVVGAGPGAEFEHHDWGTSVQCPVAVHTLRASTTGRYVSLAEDGTLVDDAATPDGWTVEELWELHDDGAETLLFANARQRYVTVAADGRLVANAATPQGATRFVLTRVRSGSAQAAAAAGAADRVVLVLGNDPHINGRETVDRDGLALPAEQEELLRAVRRANPDTVLILVSSYPYAIDWAQAELPAILWTSHGGQELGHAVADILLGRRNPAGRLPQTWYTGDTELPDPTDYDIIGSAWTYLYARRTPLYPVGHGLSYTSFEYSDLAVTAEADQVVVTVRVTNTGERAGEEVVQLYSRTQDAPVPVPLRQLRGFERIGLVAGASTVPRFVVDVAALGHWDESAGALVRAAGEVTFLIGRSSADIAAQQIIAVGAHPADPPW